MTTDNLPVPAAAAQPDRVGQATAVEQSRAIAEVQGAILVAQRCPRNVPGAVAAMEESCTQIHLAEKAFFRFPRAGETVSGPSVYLARELARTWGNVQYGVSELRRDDVHGQSEMLAYAWDVQTNTRVETKFVVPHKRDTKKGVKDLTDMRDIYENNANSGARRVRECIFSILPPWFVDRAKELCRATIVNPPDAKPLPQRIADVIKAFAGLGVSVDQLERKVDRNSEKWTPEDIAQLTVIGRSLRNGEVSKDDEFPPERLTADDLGAPPEKIAQPAKATPAQLRKITDALRSCGVTEEAEVLTDVGQVLGRVVPSLAGLSRDEAQEAVQVLERMAGSDEPGLALDSYLAELDQVAS